MPRASRNIKRSFPQCLEIEIPFSVASSDDNARNFVVPLIGVNQIAVRTIGQMLIAKDEIDFLAGEHFLSLRPRGAGNDIRGKSIERENEANFQLRRSDQ